MLVLTLLTLPRIWGPKSRPAPKIQAPASTGMATAITKHFFPGPRWSPELGRREPALLSLQIQKTQFQLAASQAQSIAQRCRSGQWMAANIHARMQNIPCKRRQQSDFFCSVDGICWDKALAKACMEQAEQQQSRQPTCCWRLCQQVWCSWGWCCSRVYLLEVQFAGLTLNPH